MQPQQQVDIGPVAAFSETSCTPVADGIAVVIRRGDQLQAFRNRCLHQDSPLAGGWVRNGVLTCPSHFWRYDVRDGTLVGTSNSLQRFPVVVADGRATVTVPDEVPRQSLRDQLLARAATYDRDQAWRQRQGNPSSPGSSA